MRLKLSLVWAESCGYEPQRIWGTCSWSCFRLMRLDMDATGRSLPPRSSQFPSHHLLGVQEEVQLREQVSAGLGWTAGFSVWGS